ncbi:hypothetical protein GCM10009347_25030 [Shewanella algicola]|uniref:Uncharacterized protein n=1 Tax=Shewanella algicola TaxID=640633 RepID=A0A9X1ZAF9_9GAMM|nr:hypothetical protein [Shewanella algicola]MCL1104825.1 hypothetical protein [Shewanella algicola]GGP57500.1 hypothetical protein GCM10009347_25030 [Shewanella algicola]
MKFVIKVLVALSVTLFGLYHLAFFIMPSVTIQNNSDAMVESARVVLPNSSLDLGSIQAGGSNRIYYELEQADGEYEFDIILSDETRLDGSCGYITNSEINKRVVIELSAEMQVVCRAD